MQWIRMFQTRGTWMALMLLWLLPAQAQESKSVEEGKPKAVETKASPAAVDTTARQPAGQTPPTVSLETSQESEADKAATLISLLTTKAALRKSLEEQRRKLRSETSDSGKEAIQAEITRLEKRTQEVDRDFNVLVTGADSMRDLSLRPDETPLKLQDELGQFLSPVFADLRELTRRPREVRALQDELNRLNAEEKQALDALKEVETTQADLGTEVKADSPVRAELKATSLRWQTRLEETRNRIAVVRHQLKELDASGTTFWSELGGQVKTFVFVRAVNISLALLVFLVVLFGVRTAYYYAFKFVPVRKYEKLSFSARVLDVVHEGGSIVLAVVCALLVLYARGDWLLGGLALIAIGGLIMTAKSGIGRYMKELQFLLNLGAVREGERVTINGVPWRVGKIHMFTQLTNSVIGGPGLRLPLEELSGMVSRPGALDEPWFPFPKRSWVLLDGTTMAQITDLTPDHVEIVYGGGMKRWIPLADFMGMDVAGLSGGFARAITLGLDYRHQAQAPHEIPELLKADVRAALLETMREDELVNVIVEFEAAADSSLNFLIVGVFAGSQAPNFPGLTRLLQRAALESATRHGWNIPFPQMVVHKASEE